MKVARALQLHLRAADGRQINQRPTSDPEAYDLYLQARALLNKRTVPSLQDARELFSRAVSREPLFAAAYAGIADTCILMAEYGAVSSQEASNLAWPNVAKAVELDPNLSEGHVSRAMLLAHFDWDWPAAEGEYKRALQLNPNNVPARHWFALHLAELGRFEEALAQIAAAQTRDPLAPIVRAAWAKILCLAKRYDEALEQCRLSLGLQPNFQPALSVMSQEYVCQGRFAEAIAATRKADQLERDDETNLTMAYLHASAGHRNEAEAIIEKVTSSQEYSTYELAGVYSALGNQAEALRWLNLAIDRHSLAVVWCRVDPRLEWSRSSPQFAELLARLAPKRPAPNEKSLSRGRAGR
jgi:tetratricopeptide (TPR) repeat protein